VAGQVTLQCNVATCTLPGETITCWCSVTDSRLLEWHYEVGNKTNDITRQCGAGDGYYSEGIRSNAQQCEEESFINSSLIINTTRFTADEIEVACRSMGSEAQQREVICIRSRGI